MSEELQGVCRWCHKPITWDHWLNVWTHDDTHDSRCDSGAIAARDTQAPPSGSGSAADGVEERKP